MASSRLPRVLILYTGGTFGMDVVREGSLRVNRLTPAALRARLLGRVPELQGVAHCDVRILLNSDSAHIGPNEWFVIAATIRKEWSRYDGIVLLHGTDTLAYTASALSFLLGQCRKPVVVTGAMRPLSALRSDARRNLISAVEIAARGPRPLLRQVTVFFHDRLLQGNRTRKRSASEFDAFESPRAAQLAVVGTSIRYRKAVSPQSGKSKLRPPKIRPGFSERVAMFHVTPGFPAIQAEALLPWLDGLILVVYPSGTGPTHDPAFRRLFKTAQELQVPVVLVTEGFTDNIGAANGVGSDPAAYEAGREMLKAGCLWAGDMTPECAYVKAGLILAQPDGQRSFKKLWKRNWAGEGI